MTVAFNVHVFPPHTSDLSRIPPGRPSSMHFHAVVWHESAPKASNSKGTTMTLTAATTY